jgi:hypothetical protein
VSRTPHLILRIVELRTDGIAPHVSCVDPNELLVEAAGVEPASENVTGQETTCLFAFMPQAFRVITDASPRTFAAHAQNGQETLAASL